MDKLEGFLQVYVYSRHRPDASLPDWKSVYDMDDDTVSQYNDSLNLFCGHSV